VNKILKKLFRTTKIGFLVTFSIFLFAGYIYTDRQASHIVFVSSFLKEDDGLVI
jgi:hypothetical protein